MRRILFPIQLSAVFLLLIVSCKPKEASSQQKVSSIGPVPVETERTANVLSFDDKALYDTLSYSNIIQSVNYIPLETRQEAFIGRRVNGIKRMRDKYIIMSRNGMNASFKLFNADGTYYSDALTIGRGPVEMTFFSSYTFNDSTGLITFLDSEGGKAVKTDIVSLEKTRLSVRNGFKYVGLIALDNSNYLSLTKFIVCTIFTIRHITTKSFFCQVKSILNFLDRKERIIHRKMEGNGDKKRENGLLRRPHILGLLAMTGDSGHCEERSDEAIRFLKTFSNLDTYSTKSGCNATPGRGECQKRFSMM